MKLAALCAAIALSSAALSAELHGQTDVFAAPGASLAWGILRGPDEARTCVVVRVLTDPVIRSVTVTGRDPFTKEERILVRAAPIGGRLDVRIPRASFADFPRTDWQFFAAEKEPRLHVFYLGVPDTTPEFADESRLEAYLKERLSSQVRARVAP